MVWSSPTYHGSVSGSLKNALDWLILLAERTPPYLSNKPIGLVSTAGGVQGLQAVNTMDFIARSLRGWSVPLVMPVPQSWRSFDPEGRLIDEAIGAQLRAVGAEVARAPANSRPRVPAITPKTDRTQPMAPSLNSKSAVGEHLRLAADRSLAITARSASTFRPRRSCWRVVCDPELASEVCRAKFTKRGLNLRRWVHRYLAAGCARPGRACDRRLAGVSQPLAEPVHLPPATERQVRLHAAELVGLAARYGITALAFASPGRLRGHLADDRDLFDMFEFQRAAADLLGAEVTVYSDGALGNQHVSADLVAATPL